MGGSNDQYTADAVSIRLAVAADAGTIAEFNRALARETEGKELDLATVTNGVTRFLHGAAAGFYIVAEIGERVIGCLMITHEWSDWRDGNMWWIQSVYVPATARRQGVFRALHAWVVEQAEADPDVCGLRLYVEHENKRARTTYESLGMKQEPYLIYEMSVR